MAEESELNLPLTETRSLSGGTVEKNPKKTKTKPKKKLKKKKYLPWTAPPNTINSRLQLTIWKGVVKQFLNVWWLLFQQHVSTPNLLRKVPSGDSYKRHDGYSNFKLLRGSSTDIDSVSHKWCMHTWAVGTMRGKVKDGASTPTPTLLIIRQTIQQVHNLSPEAVKFNHNPFIANLQI